MKGEFNMTQIYEKMEQLKNLIADEEAKIEVSKNKIREINKDIKKLEKINGQLAEIML